MGLADEEFDLIDRLARNGGSELLTLFFLLLWKRSNDGRPPVPDIEGLAIPDTIVMHHSRPIYWFFTAKDGTIKMKSRKHVTTDNILTEFLQRSRKPSQKFWTASGCLSQFLQHDEQEPDGVRVSYQTTTELPSFLGNNNVGGILQSYVEPKEERGELCNNEIVPTWTPNVFYVERRGNSSKLSNVHIPLEERCSASETSRYVITTPLVSSHSIKRIELVCQTIAKHIEAVFHCRVTSLTLHLKLNKDDVPMILRCSSLRLVQDCTLPSAAMSEGERVLNGSVGLSSGVRSLSCTLRQSNAELTVTARDEPVKSWDSKSPQKNTKHSSTQRGQRSETPSVAADEPVEPSMCQLCQKVVEDPRELSKVKQCHVLLPLELIASVTTPSASPSSDGTGRRVGDPVPSHVLLLHPNMSPEEYDQVVGTNEFDEQLVALCGTCFEGIHSAVTRIRVDRKGTVPFHPFLKALSKKVPHSEKSLHSDTSVESTGSPKHLRSVSPRIVSPLQRTPAKSRSAPMLTALASPTKVSKSSPYAAPVVFSPQAVRKPGKLQPLAVKPPPPMDAMKAPAKDPLTDAPAVAPAGAMNSASSSSFKL